MRKKFLVLTVVCLLFGLLSYTYSAFNSSIIGNLSATTNNWRFKVNVNGGSVYDDSYKLAINSNQGSIVVNLDTTGGSQNVDYEINLLKQNLSSNIKFYTDSSYSNEITNNKYSGTINGNTTGSITLYYKSSSSENGNVIINAMGKIAQIATMRSYSGSYAFWNSTYRPYIKTITFNKSLSGMPSSCTEANLCWDVSESSTQTKKVYAYLVDTGQKDSTNTSQPLYNLYIVSNYEIYAPKNCNNMFLFCIRINGAFKTNLTSINFNNNFNTTNMETMDYMFERDSLLTSLDLSSFKTPSLKSMVESFYVCSNLTNLNMSNFDTSKVTSMSWLFAETGLKSLDLGKFNTSNVTNMSYMFYMSSSLTSLKLSSFNTSKVTNMDWMFYNCSALTSLDLSSFNTSNVTSMGNMFNGCSAVTAITFGSNFKTSKITSMSSLFNGCSKLTSLNLSTFDTSNVTDMRSMFSGASALKTINFGSNFDTSKVTNMSFMFSECKVLTATITIRNANTTTYNEMFSNAATGTGAKITVNYTSATSTLVTNMIATKTITSKVVKGSQV